MDINLITHEAFIKVRDSERNVKSVGRQRHWGAQSVDLHPPTHTHPRTHTQLIRGCLASDDSSLGEAASRVVEAIILKGMEPNGSVRAKLPFSFFLANTLSPSPPASIFR
jgi:hypothetical protein